MARSEGGGMIILLSIGVLVLAVIAGLHTSQIQTLEQDSTDHNRKIASLRGEMEEDN